MKGNETKAYYLVTTMDTHLCVIGDPMNGVQQVTTKTKLFVD